MSGLTNRVTSMRVMIYTLLMVAFGIVILSGCGTASAPEQRNVAVTTSGTPTVVPTAPTVPVPPPVGTIEPPTTTPAPILPTYTPAPLPWPPQATSLPLLTPTPGAATPTLSAKPSGGLEANIAWGVATDNDLTIWVGTYSDTPSPSISNSRPIVKWATPLTLVDMAVSPDHQSLAVLTVNPPMAGEEGVRPTWLYVIDLSTNAVQGVPDYDNYYSLYEYYFYQSPNRILGWLDNDRFSVQQQTGDVVAAIAGKDGSTYSKVSFPPVPPADFALDTALSPDRRTFFSMLTGNDSGYWLYGTDGSNPRQVMSPDNMRSVYHPIWSPDSSHIGFVSPKVILVEGTNMVTDKYLNIWTLDLSNSALKPVTGDNVWDVDPAWSVDSATIAFLRADAPISDDNLASYYDDPTAVETNIYTASISDLTPHKLTNFTTTRNSYLQWTGGGNLILASATGSSNPGTGLSNLIVVSSNDGTATTLISGSSGESIRHPTLFR